MSAKLKTDLYVAVCRLPERCMADISLRGECP